MTAVTPERDEPVAWRGKLGSDPTRQHWHVCSIDPTGLPGWHSVEPLYTHTTPSPATDEVVWDIHLRAEADGLRLYNGRVRIEGPWSPSEYAEALSALRQARSLLAKLEVRG